MPDFTALFESFSKTLGPKDRPRVFVPLVVPIIRTLARGVPISPSDLAEATKSSIDEVNQILDGLKDEGVLELNAEGLVTGMLLSLTKTKHQFEVAGRILHTWCALDALLLPKVLDADATVTSTCPETEGTIRLTITPEGIQSAHPAEVYVSIVGKDTCSKNCCGKPAGVRGSLCSNIHFLASKDAANTWLAKHPFASVVPAVEAYELGTIWSDGWLAAYVDDTPLVHGRSI